MEKQEINIDEEVKILEQQIGLVIVEGAKSEIDDSTKRIDIMFGEIERALTSTKMIPKDKIRRTVERMKDELGRNMTAKEIASTREHEYVATKANLSTVGADKRSIQGQLEDVSQNGIVSIDDRYNKSIDSICETLMEAFRKPLMAMNNREADMAFDDIRIEIKKGGASLKNIHQEYTKRIKQAVAYRINELGIRVNSELEQTVEKQAAKNADAFLETLQKDTISDEEVAAKDAKDLSENEKAFRGSEEPMQSNKSKYESMFK